MELLFPTYLGQEQEEGRKEEQEEWRYCLLLTFDRSMRKEVFRITVEAAESR